MKKIDEDEIRREAEMYAAKRFASGEIADELNAFEAGVHLAQQRLLQQTPVTCRVGAKCLANFGEGEVLRNCTVIDVNEDGFTVEADGLGWKMGPIPMAKFRPAHGR